MAALEGHRLKHESVDYSGLEGFAPAVAPFVEAALSADEPVMVAVGKARIRALQEALGERSGAVEFVELETLGSSPSRIISTWRRFARGHFGQGLRGVTEPIWPGSGDGGGAPISPGLHESLLGLALAQVDLRMLHARDTTRVPPAVRSGEANAGNPVPERATELAFTAGHLGNIRNYMVERARRAGLTEGRASDVALAVHELATNSVHHGGGGGSLLVWNDDELMYCEVRDGGAPPHDGDRSSPDELLPLRGGRGLWLVDRLCDRVDVRPFGPGHAIRVAMDLTRDDG